MQGVRAGQSWMERTDEAQQQLLPQAIDLGHLSGGSGGWRGEPGGRSRHRPGRSPWRGAGGGAGGGGGVAWHVEAFHPKEPAAAARQGLLCGLQRAAKEVVVVAGLQRAGAGQVAIVPAWSSVRRVASRGDAMAAWQAAAEELSCMCQRIAECARGSKYSSARAACIRE